LKAHYPLSLVKGVYSTAKNRDKVTHVNITDRLREGRSSNEFHEETTGRETTSPRWKTNKSGKNCKWLGKGFG